MWIDAHCHLSDDRVTDKQLKEILDQAEKQNLTHFILGGVKPREWDKQLELKRKFPHQFSLVFGLHPWWIDERAREASSTSSCEQELENALERLSQQVPTLTAIGETGLDFARERKQSSGALQLWAFQAQLELARKSNKPLVLHVVRAHNEVLALLRRRGGHAGIVHSFSGTRPEAKQYVELGLVISIGARVTHPDATELHAVAKEIPLQNLVFETDAPDQPPFGSEGKLHTPLSLFLVVKKVAELRKMDPESLLKQSRENLIRIFSPTLNS